MPCLVGILPSLFSYIYSDTMFAKASTFFLLQIFFPISYHSESPEQSHYLQESCFNDMFVKIQILITVSLWTTEQNLKPC